MKTVQLIIICLALASCSYAQVYYDAYCGLSIWISSGCSNDCGTGIEYLFRRSLYSGRYRPYGNRFCHSVVPRSCRNYSGCNFKNKNCSLTFEPGQCDAYFPVWAYNSSIGACVQAVYGGCGGNGNRFQTEEECNNQCQIDVCSLKFEAGPCRARMPVWTYNATSRTCERAIYGGCQGNDNRFRTKEACEARCPTADPCKLSFDPGMCYAAIPVWAYNSETRQCETAVYGGCGGNANRFTSKSQCEQRCPVEAINDTGICQLPFTAGPCLAYIPVWAYNAENGVCQQEVYGGCSGNANRFSSKADCDSRCPNKGSCSYSRPTNCTDLSVGVRWTYDALQKTCTNSSTTCASTPNNFPTEAECKDICIGPTPDEVCSLPFDQGPCKALVYVYAYNSTTQTCEEEIYGGCQGNANRFTSLTDCSDYCSGNSIRLPVSRT